MDSEQYAELVTSVATTNVVVSDAKQCATLLTQLNGLRSWVESRSLAVTQRLNSIAGESPGIFPEQIVANATRVSLAKATEPFHRVRAVELLPEFAAALTTGAVNVDHVDVLARSVAGLDAATKQRLADRDAFLTEVASRSTAPEFRRTLRDEIRRARADDGIARLEQQRRNTRLRTWIDDETGMWCLRGEFDPETGGILEKRLKDPVDALFHDATPDTCPADLMQKQHHLRALALLSLTERKGSGRAGTVDMSVLIDAKTLVDGMLHEHSVIDCGFGIELPVETIRRMACCADITPIIVGADGVHMDVGRTTRLANREQRRALRAMYRGCAVPGCCVAWDYVVVHHVKYFRNGGRTDIANLTIVHRDGTTMTTGPPQVMAA